jgi:ubiquinone/menaquinone biosynthesis C-methylase UbiE
MSDRGQQSFLRLPGFAARLYDSLTHIGAVQLQHREIACDLASRIVRGRILDVGTGSGRLLFELRQLSPAFELYGLDISASMVKLARTQLSGHGIEIRQGGIQNSGYDNNFFDIVTCTGSFYLWDSPQECLEEVFRILKPQQSAYLFETYRDCDKGEVRKAMKTNLAGENLVRRALAPRFFMKQLGMTYQTAEVAAIIRQTRFAPSYAIDPIRLGGLPAWLRIRLTKEA